MITPIILVLALLPVRAETPIPMGATPHPGNFYVPVIQGEVELHPDSSATEGVTTLRHEKLYQALGWEPLEGELKVAVEYERSLVYAALQREVPAETPAPAEVLIGDTTGLRWEVDGGPTVFVGTSWHCPKLRVELTSFGPDVALVRQVHKASLAGAECTPSGGLGTSTK